MLERRRAVHAGAAVERHVGIPFLIVMLTVAKAAVESRLTPAMVMRQISSDGPEAAKNWIYDDPKRREEFFAYVGTGASSWLRIANRLRPVSDAGMGEQLELAVGEGLEHRPLNVLRIAAPVFGIDGICGGPDVDDQRYDSYERSLRAVNRRIQRVRRITAPELKRARDRCISQLEQSKKGIAGFFTRR